MPANWRTKGWRRDTWRRLYVREQGTFASLPFFARATAAMLLKLCDEKGRIEVGKSGDLVEAIAFRMGAERGERRLLRKVVPQLFEEGYVVVEEGGQTVQIRNFEEAQGRTTSEHDESTTGAQPDHCGITTGSLPSNEGRVKAAKSQQTTAVIEEKRGDKKREEDQSPPVSTPAVTLSGLPPNGKERRSGNDRRESARDQRVNEFYGSFRKAWGEKYGASWAPDPGLNSQIVALLKSVDELDDPAAEWGRRDEWIARYLRDNSQFIVEARHAARFFCSQFNRYRVDAKPVQGSLGLTAKEQRNVAVSQDWRPPVMGGKHGR